MSKILTIDDKIKSFLIVGDAVIKSSGINKKIIYDVQYVKSPDFPWRIRLTCDKTNVGMALPRRITLKDFENRFIDKLNELKERLPAPSLFSL